MQNCKYKYGPLASLSRSQISLLPQLCPTGPSTCLPPHCLPLVKATHPPHCRLLQETVLTGPLVCYFRLEMPPRPCRDLGIKCTSLNKLCKPSTVRTPCASLVPPCSKSPSPPRPKSELQPLNFRSPAVPLSCCRAFAHAVPSQGMSVVNEHPFPTPPR